MIETLDNQALMTAQLFQVTVVAAVAWGLWRVSATKRPHLAHAIWALVVLKCLTPPIFFSPASPFCWRGSTTTVALPTDTSPTDTSPTDIPASVTTPFSPLVTFESEPVIDEASGVLPARPTSSQQAVSWTRPILHFNERLLWLAGAVIGLVFVFLRYVVFCLRLSRSASDCSDLIQQHVVKLQGRLGIRRAVRVRIFDGPIGPAVIGLLRPTILLPAIVVRGKTPQQLEPILAHELIHIRRGDLWWSLLQSVAKTLWWFHPLVWLSGSQLTNACEQSCDEETISGLGCEPADYARTLLDVLEIKHTLRMAPALPGVRPVDITSKRMERIMSFSTDGHTRCPKWIWVFMLAMCVCILPGAAKVGAQKPKADLQSEVTDKATETAEDDGPNINFRGPAQQSYSPYQTHAFNAFNACTYEVSDVLAKFQELGADRDQAREKLLFLLPSKAVPGIKASQEVAHMPTKAPLPAPQLPQIQPPSPVDKTSVVFDSAKQALTVNTNARTHKVIRETLQHIREFGIRQVKIEMTVLELHDETPAHADAVAVQTNAEVQDEPTVAQAGYANAHPDQISFGTSAAANATTKMLKQRLLDRTASIVSRPRVITRIGRPAKLQVGACMPITETTDGTSQNVGMVDVGFQAKLKTLLLKDGRIRLYLESSTTRATGEVDQSITKDSSGKETVRKVPVVVKQSSSSEVVCKQNKFVLIDGPHTTANEPVIGPGSPKGNRGGRLAILVACQVINPFDPEPAHANSPKAAAYANANPTKGHPDLHSNAPDSRSVAKGTRLEVGSFALQMDGDIQISRRQDSVIVIGEQATIKFYELQDSSQEEWLTLKADHIHLVMDPQGAEGADSEESIREAKLQGNVTMQFDADQKITAQTLNLARGASIVSATEVKTHQADGEDRMQADSMQMDLKTRAFHLVGNVVIQRGDTTVRAKMIKLDPKTERIITAEGAAEIQLKPQD